VPPVQRPADLMCQPLVPAHGEVDPAARSRGVPSGVALNLDEGGVATVGDVVVGRTGFAGIPEAWRASRERLKPFAIPYG
jgi:hypothetical protein